MDKQTKKELLFSVTKKDFEITWFSGRGGGGQHRNKHQNCCRIRHPKSGVVMTGQSYRSRKQNLEDAFSRLAHNERFRKWIEIEASRVMTDQISIEKKVEEMMRPENLKVEYL